MDPGRRAMIYGSSSRSSQQTRDITSPRRDPSNRVTKPSKQPPSSSSRHGTYLTEDEQSRAFIAGEDKFVLSQAKKKADIRVREHRAKPIDQLAFNLRFVDPDRDASFDDDEADVEIAVPGPSEVVTGIPDLAQLKELEADITHYHTLESNPRNREYWQALLVLCAERREALKPAALERRVTQPVSADVDRIFQSKTLDQLRQLERQIKAKLQSPEDIDVDYWEEVLRKVPIYMARLTIKTFYDEIKAKRLAALTARNPAMAGAVDQQQDTADFPSTPNETQQSTAAAAAAAASGSSTESRLMAMSAAAAAQESQTGSAAPPGTTRFALPANEDFSQATRALYEREVARGIGENEEIFTAEEAVPSKAESGAAAPSWADKYRPRKPRYFNRVQMGYEWNKYNQTHYDHDNPPPKVVQGYKFNIFYPDLIDPTKTPDYRIIREGGRRRGQSFARAGEEDTCLIRFTAGPPYEDIAFRIVDREWDYSARKDGGFKAEFKKGILQLHFQFKKIYYRK